MNLNIRLLILDTDKTHAGKLADRLMPVIPFIHYDVVGNIQQALQAHLEDPYNISIVTSAISEQDTGVFLQDMKKLYTQNKDNLCAFIRIVPELAENFKFENCNPLGFSAIISEKLDKRDEKNIRRAVADFTKFKKINEGLSDIEWTMQMILAEVDKVSDDRKRGRNTKFNTIAINFASDLVEFDTQIMDKYFQCLTEHTINLPPSKTKIVKIPKDILKKNLPKLVEDRYTGASSRVWNMLVDKFGADNKKGSEEKDQD